MKTIKRIGIGLSLIWLAFLIYSIFGYLTYKPLPNYPEVILFHGDWVYVVFGIIGIHGTLTSFLIPISVRNYNKNIKITKLAFIAVCITNILLYISIALLILINKDWITVLVLIYEACLIVSLLLLITDKLKRYSNE